MNADETKAAAAVMLAHAEGKKIEYRSEGSPLWKEVKRPSWDFHGNEYRVKREPWEGKVWLHTDGHTASYCKSDPEKFRVSCGYRLIEVKEVMP